MIRGLGVDVVEVCRFDNKEESFLKKLFTDEEISEWKRRGGVSEYLSSRFAAKEAFVKAIGEGFGDVQPKDITVRNDSSGRPYFSLAGKALEKVDGMNVLLSISHERSVAIAAVIIDG